MSRHGIVARLIAMAQRDRGHHFTHAMHRHDDDVDHAASDLIRRHGRGARQHVVDQMIAAIRAHDLAAAKRWDEIGQAVDRKLEA